MNLNNLCNVLFISLSDSDDKYDDHPFGIVLIISSSATKQTESYSIKEEHLQQMSHPYDNFIAPKIKQMIENVERLAG